MNSTTVEMPRFSAADALEHTAPLDLLTEATVTPFADGWYVSLPEGVAGASKQQRAQLSVALLLRRLVGGLHSDSIYAVARTMTPSWVASPDTLVFIPVRVINRIEGTLRRMYGFSPEPANGAPSGPGWNPRCMQEVYERRFSEFMSWLFLAFMWRRRSILAGLQAQLESHPGLNRYVADRALSDWQTFKTVVVDLPATRPVMERCLWAFRRRFYDDVELRCGDKGTDDIVELLTASLDSPEVSRLLMRGFDVYWRHRQP